MIQGGYYIKARKIQNSEIAHTAPHIREIWDWILKECNHEIGFSSGRKIERGQCIRTYKDIQEGLSWKIGWRKKSYSKDQCENAMKFLRRGSMIATQKTTRGIVITVVKYDYYQNPKNYENHNENHNENHKLPQTSHTINKNNKNNKNKEDICLPANNFEKFWEAYPNKELKKRSQEIWKSRGLDSVLDKILEFIAKAKETDRWKKGFVKQPPTFLNGECWNDDLASYQEKSNAKNKPANALASPEGKYDKY